jgi:hypothetical protein
MGKPITRRMLVAVEAVGTCHPLVIAKNMLSVLKRS